MLEYIVLDECCCMRDQFLAKACLIQSCYAASSQKPHVWEEIVNDSITMLIQINKSGAASLPSEYFCQIVYWWEMVFFIPEGDW